MFTNPLESTQRFHNKVITDSGNVSPSNSPQQVQADLKRARIRDLQSGAAKIAAGKTLGLTQEETLALISLETRKQKRADRNITEDDVKRRIAQANKTIADAGDGELAGIALREAPEVNPFGESQDDAQNFSRQEMIERDLLGADQMTDDEFDFEMMRRGDAMERPTTGAAGIRDALAQLQKAKTEQQGLSGRLSRVFGGGNEDMEGRAELQKRLEDSIQYGPKQRGAEKDLAAELVRRDTERGGFGINETAEAKYYEAEAAALAERSRLYGPGGGGAAADRALQQIHLANQPVSVDALRHPISGVYMGQDGNPLAIQGPERAISGINAPDTANMLNAPSNQSAIDYVVKQMPDYREGGRVFKDFPQSDISGAGQLFAQRVAERTGMSVPSDIRSVDELQSAITAIARITGERGTPMYRQEMTEQGMKSSRVPANQVGAQEVMNYLRYTPQESQQLANAMYQSEVARGTMVNQNAKANYFGRGAVAMGPKDINFAASEAINPREGDARVARIAASATLGKGREKKNIKAEFRKLGPGASSNFIGEVEGGNPNIPGSDVSLRYNTTGETDPIAIEKSIRDKDRQFAENKARTAMKKEGALISPMRVAKRAESMGSDESVLKDRIVKSQLVNERALRDNKRRNEKEMAIRTRSGPQPPEPGRMGGAFTPSQSPTGPTQSGDSYGSRIAAERYNRNIAKQREDEESIAAQIRRIRGMR